MSPITTSIPRRSCQSFVGKFLSFSPISNSIYRSLHVSNNKPFTRENDLDNPNSPFKNDPVLKSPIYYLNEYKNKFPGDKSTIRLINVYNGVNKMGRNRLKIGVTYKDEEVFQSSKLIEGLLADPLASENKEWFDKIRFRDRQKNYKFIFSERFSIENDLQAKNTSIFRIPSPVLDAYRRPKFIVPENKARDQVDYEINEINENTGVSECHLYIEVSSGLTVRKETNISDHVSLSIVDSKSYSPPSKEDVIIEERRLDFPGYFDIKVDTGLLYNGISSFLDHDIKAANDYALSITNSNIILLFKTMGYLSTPARLKSTILKAISTNIKNFTVDCSTYDELSKVVKSEDIREFTAYAHSELQRKFIPELDHFFKKKLSWWKLYIKNDDVEYDLKEFLNKKFMNESIEAYNFYRGQIVSKMKKEDFSPLPFSETINPLAEFKKKLIDEKVPNEIQPIVHDSLIKAFIYYQLPISVLAISAYVFFTFTLNSAVALGLLGWVVGFNHVSKTWTKTVRSWSSGLNEDVRVNLSRDCVENGLLREINQIIDREKQLSVIQNNILQGISK